MEERERRKEGERGEDEVDGGEEGMGEDYQLKKHAFAS